MDGGLRGGAALSLACCPPRCRGGPERQRTAARSGRCRRRVPRRPSTRTGRRSARPARRGRRRSGRAWAARRPPRAPLRRYPTPSCDVCPVSATVALRRAVGAARAVGKAWPWGLPWRCSWPAPWRRTGSRTGWGGACTRSRPGRVRRLALCGLCAARLRDTHVCEDPLSLPREAWHAVQEPLGRRKTLSGLNGTALQLALRVGQEISPVDGRLPAHRAAARCPAASTWQLTPCAGR